ncbi:MAG: ECF-type sigma factor [Proteobacteria bacterium]|nr:ECF-type sigma factor [Pseudomonadota bacterium]
MNESSDLFEYVYDQLRVLAARHFRDQPTSSTLQPTALVHEVYVRLARHEFAGFNDREHFLAVAATAMRQIVIDRARRRKAAKRGGDYELITLNELVPVPGRAVREVTMDVLEVDELITRLTRLSPRQARVVELRIFAGMTVAEIANTLRVSVATVEKDWRQARAWMRMELDRHRSS